MKSRRVRRPGRPPSAVSWRGGLPRPSELASDGRAQPTALGGRSFGMASCPGPRGRAARSWCRRVFRAPEAGRLTLPVLASSPPSPSPPKRRRGGLISSARVTRGGARASLTPGYLLKPRTGFSDGAHYVRGCCGGGVALAAGVRAGRALTRWPYGELCWSAECEPHGPDEHLHSEPRMRHGAALGECEARAVVMAASAALPTVVREAAYFCLCGADGRARGAFDDPRRWKALPASELDGCLVARARSERAAGEGVR